MKKLLYTILFACLIAFCVAVPLYATTYYACNASQAINGNSTWCTTAHRTGSCSGDGTYTSYVTLTSSDTLIANGCTVTIPEQFVGTFVKISNKTDGTATDGGQFTVVTTGWTHTNTSLTASVETGATTGAALAISGTGNQNPVFTLLPTTITASASLSTGYGVNDGHTVGTVVVGSANSPFTVTGGAGTNTHGYYFSGGTGSVTWYGTGLPGTAGSGIQVAGNTNTLMNGTCTGSDAAASFYGCMNAGSGVMTIAGKINYGTRSAGANGSIAYTPAAGDYVSFKNGTPVYVGLSPAAAKIAPDTLYINNSTGSQAYGTLTVGRGAWMF